MSLLIGLFICILIIATAVTPIVKRILEEEKDQNQKKFVPKNQFQPQGQPQQNPKGNEESSLRMKCHQLTKENAKLKDENLHLKVRIQKMIDTLDRNGLLKSGKSKP